MYYIYLDGVYNIFFIEFKLYDGVEWILWHKCSGIIN